MTCHRNMNYIVQLSDGTALRFRRLDDAIRFARRHERASIVACQGGVRRPLKQHLRLMRGSALSMLASAVIAAFAPGCAAAPAPAAEAERASEKYADMWTPQSPQPAWWAEAKPCPDGAELVGQPPPEGAVLECILPNGTRHGLSSVWFPNGHEGTLTEYRNGMQHGVWMHWLHGRKMVEGRFKNGRRHSEWTYWFDEWSDFDTQGRMQREQPLVVELYNNGMLLKAEKLGNAVPEQTAPEQPHEQQAQKKD